MIKVLLNILVCATMLVGGNMEQKNIQDYLVNSNNAQIIVDNNCYQADVDELNNVLQQMLDGSYQMPAFGVSIHDETIEALQKGVWLRLIYNDTNWVNEMNFDELLINIEPDFSGFNIIRGNQGKYEGRCYYIDLNEKTMRVLHDYILNLCNKKR